MKKISVVILISVSLLLTACGFSPRSAKDIPPQLHLLYVDADNPYDPLVIQLERILQSVNVHLVQDKHDAPVTLRINKINWVYSIPTILNSGYATTYTFTLTATYQLQTAAGTNITGPQTTSVTRSLIQNANQIYTPDATAMMKQALTRTAVILMYYHLTSLDTRHALAATFKNHKHAIN